MSLRGQVYLWVPQEPYISGLSRPATSSHVCIRRPEDRFPCYGQLAAALAPFCRWLAAWHSACTFGSLPWPSTVSLWFQVTRSWYLQPLGLLACALWADPLGAGGRGRAGLQLHIQCIYFHKNFLFTTAALPNYPLHHSQPLPSPSQSQETSPTPIFFPVVSVSSFASFEGYNNDNGNVGLLCKRSTCLNLPKHFMCITSLGHHSSSVGWIGVAATLIFTDGEIEAHVS